MAIIRTALLGASGRLGRLIDAEIMSGYANRLTLTARLGRAANLDELAGVDLVIDVSLPAGTERLIAWLESNNGGPGTLVSGTTGLGSDRLGRLRALGSDRKILHATNFSAGVATLAGILRQAAPVFRALGYTPVITETHHRHKKDAPSGTALTLQESLDAFDDVQTHSIRAGEVPGTHEVTFFGEHDQLSIRHEARDRRAFAIGAIEAALWIHALERKSGEFTSESYFRERFFGRQPASVSNSG